MIDNQIEGGNYFYGGRLFIKCIKKNFGNDIEIDLIKAKTIILP